MKRTRPENAIPAALGDALGFNVHRLGLLFRRKLISSLHAYGLTPERWQVLTALAFEKRPITQAAIAQLTLLDRHSVSRMIKKMAAGGWVVKTDNPDDERGFLVSPTARARGEYPAIRRTLFRDFDGVLRSISAGERDRMIATAKKLMKAFGT